MGMQDLLVDDLKLGFEHFQETVVPQIQETASYRIVKPELDAAWMGLQALPGALTGGLPQVANLKEADRSFDTAYKSIHKVLEAWIAFPSTPAAVVATLKTARDQLVPSVSETQLSYVSQAALSRQRRPKLEALRPALALMTAADGRPFADCIAEMFDYGESLDTSLQARVREELDAAAPERARLRTAALSALGFLEDSLVREVRTTAALPRDLADRALAYFRKLAEMRTQQNRQSSSAPAS